jgi:hypothetical protein
MLDELEKSGRPMAKMMMKDLIHKFSRCYQMYLDDGGVVEKPLT